MTIISVSPKSIYFGKNSVTLTKTGYKIEPTIVGFVFSVPRKTKLAINNKTLPSKMTNEGSKLKVFQ